MLSTRLVMNQSRGRTIKKFTQSTNWRVECSF